MDFRTDLALERKEMLHTELEGVIVEESQNEECKITKIQITDEEAAQKLGKGIGKYITIEMNVFSDEATVTRIRLRSITESLKELLPKKKGTVVVVGVGNRDMTSDALGPETADMILATRHIDEEMRRLTGLTDDLRSVAAFSTGVLGQTGIESGEYIKSICDAIKPAYVITIDALAAGSVSRLGRTVQMSDTGIAPGSGIGNTRKRIDEEYLGVPVIAIGIPTVVDAISLACEISGVDFASVNNEKISKANGLVVAPKDIDMIVKNASYLLALSLNCALQPSLTTEELYALM